MDIGEKDKFELEERDDDHMNYHSPSTSSDWRFERTNLTNSSMGLIPSGKPMSVCKADLISSSSCSSASMVDTYGSTFWNHPSNSQNLGFCDISVQNSGSTSNLIGISKGSPDSQRSGIDRTIDLGWNPPNSMLKGGIFLPNLPHTLSQLPSDSAFIERAARFSCFGGGTFSSIVNPFSIPESMVRYSKGGGMRHGVQEVFMGTGLNSESRGLSQEDELNAGIASQDVSLPIEHERNEGSTLKNEKSESLVRPQYEVKGVGGSSNESDEPESSGGGGGGGQDDQSMLDGVGVMPSPKGISLKRRRRGGQYTKHDQVKKGPDQPGEVANDTMDIQKKGYEHPTLATNKSIGKQGSQASDPSKEEYIHVRARRGQATNSHSLAERVRREKISERMKFLQDLVPGCSKVTGKAVMLDEIINYVQSLQRQVEFLSMKLATVNPQLDFTIEGLLAKNILRSRSGGPSSSLGFPSDMSMAFPPMLASQPGLIQAGLRGMGTSSDVLSRTFNSQLTPMTGGFKESSQVPDVWDDELHNVCQMSFGTSSPLNSQDINSITH